MFVCTWTSGKEAWKIRGEGIFRTQREEETRRLKNLGSKKYHSL